MTLETSLDTSMPSSAAALTPQRPNAWSPLLKVRRIYLEREVPLFKRGLEILERFPSAERIEVRSHWDIPELFGNEGSAEDWIANKREVLVLGQKKSISARPNSRS